VFCVRIWKASHCTLRYALRPITDANLSTYAAMRVDLTSRGQDPVAPLLAAGDNAVGQRDLKVALQVLRQPCDLDPDSIQRVLRAMALPWQAPELAQAPSEIWGWLARGVFRRA
jgi:hypothetical protein